MMKRILACAVAVACLLTACATFALADGIAMKVIKVNEAVNMRQQTNTDSAIVGKVPKGTVLEGCTPVEGSQWIAVTYQGIAGYIRGDFLEPVDGSAPAAAPAAPAAAPASGAAAADADVPAVTGNTPVENPPVANINQATDYNDDFVILDQNVNGVRVMARQIFTKTNEYLMIVGLDGNGDQIWKRETATEDISEMTQTEAFMGGTEAMPLVLMYNDWIGLSAIDPATGDIKWDLPKDKVFLGGSISYAVGGNGVAYIGGYYGPDPVAIDAGGNVLWQASSGDQKAQWLQYINLTSDGISCYYSSMAGEKTGTIVYDYNGTVQNVVYD